MNRLSSRRQRMMGRFGIQPSKFKDSVYPTVYYLSTILKDQKEIYDCVIDITTNLIVQADLYDKATNLLEKTRNKLIKRNLIKPISQDQQDSFRDRSCINYEYDIDKYIDRNYQINPRHATLQLDLYRTILTSNTPVFHHFLNNLFLYDENNTKEKKISAKARREINSTKKVNFLINQVGLSKEEAMCMLVKFRLFYCNDLYRICKEYEVDMEELIPELLHITQSEYRKINKPDGKLRSYGFINEDGEISDDFIDCIAAESIEPFFSEYLKPLDCSKAFSSDTFNIPKGTTDIMKNLLLNQDSSSILLYGKPGSGKTEYAKSLAKETGFHTYIFKNENELLTGIASIARLNCYLSIQQKDSIVIVDEADKILSTVTTSFFGPTPSATKGTINQLLENNQNKIIWIINHTKQIDESTRRRFTMSYRFDNMPVSMLTSITKSKLAPLALSEGLEEQILQLFYRYSVTGASVNNIVKTISAFKCTNPDDDVLLQSVKTVLQENSKLLDSRSSSIRENVSSSYDPNVINTSLDPNQIVNMVKNAQEFSLKNHSTENGIRMLFYGISGSGKTELVRYIAQKLNKKILIKRPSDILNCYVGETEVNIKKAFNQAVEEDKILLFDEADTFFSDRSNANQSWERNATNEFLTQMEEFPGILICTTNLKDIMDPATERRFHIMVEFKPMKKEGIKTLLENYFSNYQFTDSQITHLFSIGTVTPGDFGALSSRIRFMDPELINADYIVDELEKLQRDKHYENNEHASIGFTI